MRVIVLVIIEVIRFQLARCQLGGGGGGPSSFGYDASSACSKPFSRTGRERFEHLPCDFQRQTWCTVAGSAYPWQAVRRFVQENQGLMRRMYGDEKHVNVLRAELEKNNVDIEFDDDQHHRYSDDLRHFQYENEDEYEYDDSKDDDDDLDGSIIDGSKENNEGRGFTSKILNEANLGWFSSFPKLGEYTRPHFRPTGSPAAETRTTMTPTTTGKLSTRLSLTEVTENVTEAKTDKQDSNDDASTTPFITLAQIIKVQNLSINEISGQLDRVDIDVNVESLTESSAIPESTADVETTEESDVTTTGRPTTMIVDESTITDEPASERNNAKEEEFVSVDNEQQYFRPRPEYRPPLTNVRPLEGSSTEGQQELYQDVAAKEQQEPVIQLRGVNACPVKEEVVAPFWANNTRGEVLALLNLYPFEQYVHWEKCTHENKQMYCRDGCRCEQQFRLHRLLAYDPSNECRGIFSDWFKFPSCCVCRCYDLPIELRVTSRSPRTHRLKRFK